MEKKAHFIGSSREDISGFPEEVRTVVGFALYEAQLGGKSTAAKPLKGFKGASVLEVVEDYDGDTYRAVYTVRFAGAVYVLHAFQKKSKKGIKTAKHDIDLIKERLNAAAEHYAMRYQGKRK